jgi:hypothetical protein
VRKATREWTRCCIALSLSASLNCLAKGADCARLEGGCQEKNDEKDNEKSNDWSTINVSQQWEANAGRQDAPQSHAGWVIGPGQGTLPNEPQSNGDLPSPPALQSPCARPPKPLAGLPVGTRKVSRIPGSVVTTGGRPA